MIARHAHAGSIINCPLYLGLQSGLVGFWACDGPTVSADLTGSSVFAANSGGGSFGASDGITYAAETGVYRWGTYSTGDAITHTTDDTLYQSERHGNFSYNVSLASGGYTVTLEFAAVFSAGAGQRVFDVAIEGVIVLDNPDIYAVAGHDAALDYSFPVTLTDGTLNIVFTSVVDNAKVSPINIVIRAVPLPTSRGRATTARRPAAPSV